MTAFLLVLAKLVVGVVLFDGLVVGFLWLFSLVDHLRTDFSLWEAEFRSSREAAMRQHPAGRGR